jgi:hypothetical protein
MKRISTIKNVLKLVAALGAAFLLFRTGKSCNQVSNPKGDTAKVVRDTVLIIEKHDSTYRPQIVNITNPVTYKPYLVTDTLWGSEPTDTAAILAKYYQKVFYSDTQKLSRGKIIISDTVSRNRIESRRLQTFNTDTTITNTITLTQPKRLVVYIGGSVIGNQQHPLYLAGPDLSIKWRDDKIVTLGMFVNLKGQLFYQTGLKYPIRLKSLFHK